MRDAGQELAQRIFGISKMFGYWPMSSVVRSLNCPRPTTISARDWFQLLVIFIVYLGCGYVQYHVYHVESTSTTIASPIELKIYEWSLGIYLFTMMLSIILAARYQRTLLKLVTVLQTFEKNVSIIRIYLLALVGILSRVLDMFSDEHNRISARSAKFQENIPYKHYRYPDHILRTHYGILVDERRGKR